MSENDEDKRHDVVFISVPELAQRVGISAEHAYRLACIGNLPRAFQLGTRYVVNWDVFLASSKPP